MRKLLAIFFFATSALAAEKPATAIDLLGGAEVFSIDRSHSYLGFSIGFLGLTTVRGTFRDYGATIVYDDAHPERSSMTVVIDPASIDTGTRQRDDDLKGATFFDVAHFPDITFQSTRIEKKGDKKANEQYLLHGNLTIKGVTKEIALPVTRTVHRAPDAAWGNIRIGGTGSVVIQRRDFHIDGNEFWGAEKTLSNDVTITLDILGNRPNYDRWTFQSKEKPSIGEVALQTLESSGAAAAVERVRTLKRDQPNDYNFGAGQLGIAVNRLMQHGKFDDALALLEVGRELYPEEPGFWARSGEAYAIRGDKARAVAMYEMARELSKNGTEATEMLRRLR